jgi:tetratricopeptide (TPR) repeat protein
MIKKFYNLFGKILEYGLPVMCFLLAVSFYMKTYDSCQIKISIVHVGGAIFTAIWLLKNIFQMTLVSRNFIELENKEVSFKNYFYNEYLKKFNHFLFIPVLLFLFYSVFSYSMSPFKVASMEELVKRMIYIFTFFIVATEFDSLKKIERLIFWAILGTLVSSFYGLIQILGLDPLSWKGAFGDRVFSTFGNPNFFSAYLVWTVPIIISYIFLTRKWAYSIIVILGFLGIFASQSKASWIGISFAIIAFTFCSIRYFSHLKKENLKKIMTLFVIGFIIFCSLGVWYFISKRIDSVRFRVFTWESTWQMINDPVFVSKTKSRILGTGIGTFKIVYPAYRQSEIFYIEGKHNTATDHPENEFLEVLYDDGILGFGIFIWMLFLFYFASLYKISYVSKTIGALQRKNLDSNQKNDIVLQHYLVGVTCGLVGMCFHNLMCVNMRFVSSGFCFWLMLGMILAIIKIYENPKLENISQIQTVSEKQNKNFGVKYKIILILAILLSLIVTYFAVFFAKKGCNFFMADIHHNRGIYFSKNKMYAEAIKEYRKTVELNPGFVMAYYFMGNVFLDSWDMQKKYNPDLGDKKNVYRTDADRSLEMYDKVKSIAPNYVQTHFQVGTIYLKLGEYDKAIENFEKYLKLDPVFIYTYLQLAEIYTAKGDLKKADEVFNEALKYNPNSSDLSFNFGNLWYNQGNIEKAKEFYIKAIEFDKNNVQAYKNLVYIYSIEGNKKEFTEWGRKLVLLLPPDDEFVRTFREEEKNAK